MNYKEFLDKWFNIENKKLILAFLCGLLAFQLYTYVTVNVSNPLAVEAGIAKVKNMVADQMLVECIQKGFFCCFDNGPGRRPA